MASGRLSALLCQHFSATSQTALEIPGASKRSGLGGRLPFETMEWILKSLDSGKGTFPVTSWKRGQSVAGWYSFRGQMYLDNDH